jgi:hypothetical protein
VEDRADEAVGWLDSRHVFEFVGLIPRLLAEFAVGGALWLFPWFHHARRKAVVDPRDRVAPLLDSDNHAVGGEEKDYDALLLREVVKVGFGVVGEVDALAYDVVAGARVRGRAVNTFPGPVGHYWKRARDD